MIKKVLGGIYTVIGCVFMLTVFIPNSGGLCAGAIGIVLVIYGLVNVFSK